MCLQEQGPQAQEGLGTWLVLARPPTSFGGVGVTCVGVWGAVDEGREVGVG